MRLPRGPAATLLQAFTVRDARGGRPRTGHRTSLTLGGRRCAPPACRERVHERREGNYSGVSMPVGAGTCAFREGREPCPARGAGVGVG